MITGESLYYGSQNIISHRQEHPSEEACVGGCVCYCDAWWRVYSPISTLSQHTLGESSPYRGQLAHDAGPLSMRRPGDKCFRLWMGLVIREGSCAWRVMHAERGTVNMAGVWLGAVSKTSTCGLPILHQWLVSSLIAKFYNDAPWEMMVIVLLMIIILFTVEHLN